MSASSIILPDETKRQIASLAQTWGEGKRHRTAVIVRSVERVYTIEQARKSLSDSDFLAFLTEYLAEIEA